MVTKDGGLMHIFRNRRLIKIRQMNTLPLLQRARFLFYMHHIGYLLGYLIFLFF
jgi:hypothetical protein